MTGRTEFLRVTQTSRQLDVAHWLFDIYCFCVLVLLCNTEGEGNESEKELEGEGEGGTEGEGADEEGADEPAPTAGTEAVTVINLKRMI